MHTSEQKSEGDMHVRTLTYGMRPPCEHELCENPDGADFEGPGQGRRLTLKLGLAPLLGALHAR